MSVIVTSGADYADGLNGRSGTPTPSTSIIVQAYGGGTLPEQIPLEEDEGSPEIERAEQATLTHRFTLPWSEALNQIQFLGRGTLFTDSFGNVTKIMSAKIQRQAGRRATLIIVSEGLSFDSPPDRFEIVPVELGLNILKHPRYFYALQGENSTQEALNQNVIRAIQNYFENPSVQFRQWLEGNLYYSFGHLGSLNGDGSLNPSSIAPFTPAGQTQTVYPIAGTDLAKAAATEIIQKYWHGEETPYIVGYQMTWTVYYWRPQYLNPGGYIENPVFDANPQVPAYFVSPSYPPTYFNLITDQMAAINPQCYSATGFDNGGTSISWLRKADQIEEERTWFKHIRTWIGSAVGFWDPDIYAATQRPMKIEDYDYVTSAPILIAKPANASQ